MTSAEPSRPITVTVTDVAVTDLAAIRRHVTQAAESSGIDELHAGRFTLAVSEIAANAIKHGQPPRSVTITSHTGRVTVEVRDHGPGFNASDRVFARPNLEDPGGRGLWLAHQWSDDLDITSAASGTTVQLTAVADAS